MKHRLVVLFLGSIMLVLMQHRAQGQERVAKEEPGQSALPVSINHQKDVNVNRVSSITDTLSLPFLDDFSAPGIFPSDSLWYNNDVFVNNTMPFYPITYGVATFDGVNHRGNPYNIVTPTTYGFADSLVSHPIHLDARGAVPLNPDSNVYLSFYYQPQGRGNAPEPEDSLVLFFKDSTGHWRHIWAMPGREITGDTNFVLVMIPITDPQYFYAGFQFMFRNYATLSGMLDVWNVDYVKLDAGRSPGDSIYNDCAFVGMPSTLLTDYQQMPWQHYLLNPSSHVVSSFHNTITNRYNVVKFLDYGYEVLDETGTALYTLPAAPDNIEPFATSGYQHGVLMADPPFSYTFAAGSGGERADFLVRNHIATTPDENRRNDTILFHQLFDNYYAYDDGSAENAYGLNAIGGMLAYRFSPLKTDTLQGIYMYFEKMLTDVSMRTFLLTVWSDDQGRPGTVLYQSAAVRPMYRNWMNTFWFYKLDTPLLIDAGQVIYVGWVQNTANLLNIGLDCNTDSKEKVFFNTTGTWYSSLIPGSLMMRPAFGGPVAADINVGGETLTRSTELFDLQVYPNPVRDVLRFNTSALQDMSSMHLLVINALGQCVLQVNGFTKELDVSTLPTGLYLLKATDTKQGHVVYKKFVIQR